MLNQIKTMPYRCGFNFEIVYYILSGDYNDFMNTHQNILFQIKESLEKENVSMAFPSRTVYLKK